MNYKIKLSEEFLKNIKTLAKKYRNIKNDIKSISDELSENPFLGVEIGTNTYKVRVKNSDNNKGKSGGYRVITYVVDEENNIFLVTIYSKSEQNNILNMDLKELIRKL